MKLTGDHVWGPYPDPDHAVHVLRGVVDAGITLIDTADVYGPHVGLSNVTLEQLRIAQSIVPIAAVTALYNVTVRVGADLLAAAEADGIAFVPWHPVTTTDGLLASRAAQVLPPIAATHGAGVRQISRLPGSCRGHRRRCRYPVRPRWRTCGRTWRRGPLCSVSGRCAQSTRSPLLETWPDTVPCQ
jgi:hypothetical protein